eukprot:CCRYP_013219-RA/>CCRYP_013219-RA protein AED:0.04 eAED:0.04 QI:203/1/1/1/1/1/2/669/651
MPLHEYLEKRRRQNIRLLNTTGACHICGSSCRHSGGLNRLLDDGSAGAANEAAASMRTCGCYGSSWPYSLRVCEMCIRDDVASSMGRVRHCGICGVVACDEECGVDLVECTDVESWNNPGCLECRKMESFREIEIFRTPPPANFQSITSNNGENVTEGALISPLPRMTRVCSKCLSSFTPWVKYDFVCRRFKCQTRLVPSDIAERKRHCLLASSRSPLLKILPEDGLVGIVDFLGGEDLCTLFRTCSTMCIVAERVAKTRVEKVADQYPTGPICISSKKCFVTEPVESIYLNAPRFDHRSEVRPWIYTTSKHEFGLRAPDDSRTWVGVYHYLEKMTAHDFYFDFQNDDGAVCRFIRQDPKEKFVFDKTVYLKVGQDLTASIDLYGIAVRGGQVSIFSEGLLSRHPVTFVSRKVFAGTSKQYFIGRLFCPGSGDIIQSPRNMFGSVGIMRIHRTGSRGLLEEGGPAAKWVQKVDISEGYLRDDSVFGVEYDPENQIMKVLSFGSSSVNRSISTELTVLTGDGDNLFLAVELTLKADLPQTLLTIRECNSDVWTQFLDFHPSPAPDQVETVLGDIDEIVGQDREGGIFRRIRRRVDDLRVRRIQDEFRLRNVNVGARGEPMDADRAGDDDVVEVDLAVAEEDVRADELMPEAL